MNHTVVVDEDYRDRRFENRLNAVVRHCRIVNVVKKQQPAPLYWQPLPLMWDFNAPHHAPSPEPRKCSCKPGQACGNAACPHLGIAIC